MIKKILTFCMASAFLISCSDDDLTGRSKEVSVIPSASYEITGGMADIAIDEATIDAESGMTYTVTATLSEAVSYDTYIDLTKTAGNVGSSDYSTSRIFIPALETTGTGSITINQTPDIEGEETLTITANTSSPNVNGTIIYNFTITDFVDKSFDVILGWCVNDEFTGTTPSDDTVTGTFSSIDFDYILADSTFTIIGGAETGSCPEVVTFDSTLADGDYYIAMRLYENPYENFGLGVNIPFEFSYQYGYESSATPIASDIAFTTDTPANPSGFLGIAFVVTKAGETFTVAPF